MSLFLNILSRLVITILPRSKRLLISWLQSPSAVILEPPKIKSDLMNIRVHVSLSVLVSLVCMLSSGIAQLYGSSVSIFFIGSFIFLVLSCMSCLYILEINSFVSCFIFYYFLPFRRLSFTFLIVSFVVQKFLSLITSHLFIFAFISITLGGGS